MEMTSPTVTTSSPSRGTQTPTHLRMKVNWIGEIFVCKYNLTFPKGAETGGETDETIKDLGESLGLNNWQTVAAIIGATLKWEMPTFKLNFQLQFLFVFAWVSAAGARGDF